jgi:DNA mismatch repair ATPase MutL
VLDQLKCYALIHTHIRFSFRHCENNTPMTWTVNGSGVNMQDKVTELFGRELSDQLCKVQWNEGDISIEGLLPKLDAGKMHVNLCSYITNIL